MLAVDVIIPTRNRLPLLRRALASVLAQTHADFTIFVANDGSTDETAQWLSNLNHPKIKHLNIPTPVGPSAARNKVTRLGNAPLISFLDDDDEYLPNHLSHCLSVMNQPNAGNLLLTSYQNEWAASQYRNQPLPEFRPSAQMLFRMMIYRIVIVSTSQMMVRRAAFQQVGGFDTNLSCYEDHDLALRLLKHSGAQLLNGFSWKKRYVATSISRSLDRLDPFLTLARSHNEYANECFGYTNAWLYRYLLKSKFLNDKAHRDALVTKVRSFGLNWTITPGTLAAFRQLDGIYNHYLKGSKGREPEALERFFHAAHTISVQLKPMHIAPDPFR